MTPDSQAPHVCYHCGDLCRSSNVVADKKTFCCTGCLEVFRLLEANDMCAYYSDANSFGQIPIGNKKKEHFAFLDHPAVEAEMVRFKKDNRCMVEWHLPQMHCSSCVWLLEHLHKLDPGITSTRVHFLEKTLTINFDASKTRLSDLAFLLGRIGYEPHFEVPTNATASHYHKSRGHWIVLGVTGFCFGNIMLLSLPEYLGLDLVQQPHLVTLLRTTALVLGTATLAVGGRSFFAHAWQALRTQKLHIDLGIALSLLLTYSRSAFEILSQTGSGYLDSMAGILFFMHIGRSIQNKTHRSIHFDLDYKRFFPLSVQRVNEDKKHESIPIQSIAPNDLLLIAHQEIVPADCVCLSTSADIDYSFVTGESQSTPVHHSEIIYAGGRNLGTSIQVKAIKPVNQSYLTQLWQNDIKQSKPTESSFGDRWGSYFTLALLLISLTSFVYWHATDSNRAWNALTTVLVVACPCALLLSGTFTQGSILRLLRRYDIFVKNAAVLECIPSIDTVVFDKTGTLTGAFERFAHVGEPLLAFEKQAIAHLAAQSSHPYSKALSALAPTHRVDFEITHFKQEMGKGLTGVIQNQHFKLGSAEYLGHAAAGGRVYIQINGYDRGYFQFEHQLRDGIHNTLTALRKRNQLRLLSGDGLSTHHGLSGIFKYMGEMKFKQSPIQKQHYIQKLQNGHRVMMIGDGLNDAGALSQSDVGVAVSDRSNHFSPACDVLISGSSLKFLPGLFRVARASRMIIYASFALSLLYNAVGLYYATRGQLSPLLAAILMPLSSISIILFTQSAAWISCQISFKTDSSHPSS